MDIPESRMESDQAGSELTHAGYRRIAVCEKTQWVKHQFDAVARQYDTMNTLLSFGVHHLWKRAAIRMLNLQSGETVLDVCGGTGDLAVLAAKHVGTAGRVALFDINREMMRAGKQSTKNAALREKIDYVQGNAEIISFPDNVFDAVTVGFGIRNLTHMEKGFIEMLRVLKPGGRMVCLEFSRPVFPVFKFLYDIYSFHIMPAIGERITGSREAYTYLPESIRLFPLPDRLAHILSSIGFTDVTYQRLTNGVAAAHLGIKPF